jgi:OOP family OmpA-OmpF porin
MKSIRRIIFLLILASLPLGGAWADAQTGQGYVTGMASYIDDDKERGVDDGVDGGQVGLGWALHDNWNIEAFASFASPSGPAAQDQLGAGLDLQLVFGRESRLTPYLFVGAGYFEVDLGSRGSHDGTLYSGGAGFLVDMFGNSPVALRAEYRYRSDNALGTTLSDQVVSLGLQIPFGGRKQVPPPVVVDPDSDGDGVLDSRDRCPGTPAGIRVDGNGCPLDSDGDGVPDHEDSCPGTVRGATVDQHGCELDGDHDGVVDRLDKCPNTRAGAQVDVAGCEIKEEIRLPGVNFESNSDRLLSGAENVLQDAAASLQRNPTIKVEVAGHTDSDGAAEYNEGLSQRRALTVRDYLIARGVSPDRMTVRGYGESSPIADNATASGKAQNRRVVLRITER